MKLHVQCDRCKKYEEASRNNSIVYASAPGTWTHLRAFREPLHIDGQYGLPDGVLTALLCGDCMPVVQHAVEAAIARKT